jgi:hypothetical protein
MKTVVSCDVSTCSSVDTDLSNKEAYCHQPDNKGSKLS